MRTSTRWLVTPSGCLDPRLRTVHIYGSGPQLFYNIHISFSGVQWLTVALHTTEKWVCREMYLTSKGQISVPAIVEQTPNIANMCISFSFNPSTARIDHIPGNICWHKHLWMLVHEKEEKKNLCLGGVGLLFFAKGFVYFPLRNN